MIKHFIIIASSYALKKRIALDYVDNFDKIDEDIKYIHDKFNGDAPFATHFFQTEKSGWEEVAKTDPYFKGVELIKDRDAFVEILLKDRKLKGPEVASYILTKIPCTHLKLEKLTYLCYADYLLKENEKLFESEIYAYTYGPVVSSVYNKYKHTKETLEEDSPLLEFNSDLRLPYQSRIIASENGVKKCYSINETLDKYGNLTASELVNLTHKKNSPWSNTKTGDKITDDSILKYHQYECK